MSSKECVTKTLPERDHSIGCDYLKKRASVATRQKSKRRALDLDPCENKIVETALLERHGRLLEAVGDTTLSPAKRRTAASELLLIATLLGNNERVH
jgi:hypothetical protein